MIDSMHKKQVDSCSMERYGIAWLNVAYQTNFSHDLYGTKISMVLENACYGLFLEILLSKKFNIDYLWIERK